MRQIKKKLKLMRQIAVIIGDAACLFIFLFLFKYDTQQFAIDVCEQIVNYVLNIWDFVFRYVTQWLRQNYVV